MKKIALGGDHAGFAYKNIIAQMLQDQGFECYDFGSYSDETVDYPDYVHPLAQAIENQEFDYGVLICGSGNGVTMTANKHQGIRAALCWRTEIAQLARQHNDANIICIPARFVSIEDAKNMVSTFLHTAFEGGRHEKRVKKIACTLL
ncbi:MAG: ribose 5-phosphate isomerase B [Microscillaceae bacterium]|nr:ribose 5-phosphate isomerase B [Microscillaceae bacterium]MDW8460638.1 ribose 5-phosphate isomerase B [Cytophagales bacterium]